MTMRFITGILAFVLAIAVLPAAAQSGGDFRSYLETLWPQAKARGISRATFDAALSGLQPDPEVAALSRRQPEYGRAVGTYLNGMVSDARIKGGVRRMADFADTLKAAEQKFGVDAAVLISIWGIETGFGANQGGKGVIRSLATLAQIGYKGDFARNELLTALLVMQEGHIPRDRMIGSWAGAMGQPQFIPSSYMKWAVDFSGDGQRDLWTSVPDVLGSIANYLKEHGWQTGMPWGFEVLLPENFDFRRSRAAFRDWSKLGVRRADGRALPERYDATLLFPSGARGPAFLVTENFNVIKTYNISDVYALAVLHLADRFRGRPAFVTRWPDNDRQLSREDRMRIQVRLTELGYKVSNVQGMIDFDQRDAIREMQVKLGMRPDGHPGPEFLEKLVARGGTRAP